MPVDYTSQDANVPYKPTAHKLLQAITTAEDLDCDPPNVITGTAGESKEVLPDRTTDKNIVQCFLQNTGEGDAYVAFDSEDADADNHHKLLAPYQELDLSKIRQRVVVGGEEAWRVAITQFRRAANM